MKAMAAAVKRGAPEPAYYLYGPEDANKDETIRYMVDRLLDPGMRDFNLDQVSAATLDPESVEALCATVPMMADRRLVIIRDVEQWKRRTRSRSAVIRYLEHPSPTTVLLLVQGSGEENPDKELLKHATPLECAAATAEEAQAWLEKRAAERGLVFAPGAMEHLLRATGADLGAIRIEVEKLGSLAAGTTITTELVGDLVGVRSGETQHDWRDAIMNDDPGRAVTLLPRVLDLPGVSGVRLVSLLGTTLIGVGITRSAFDRRQSGKSLRDAAFSTIRAARLFGLGSWGEEADLWARWAPTWPAPRIRAALADVLAADRALKNTTLSDEHGILSDMIMRLAQGGGVLEARA